MAIAFRDSATVSLNGIVQANTITLTIPVTAMVGDVMLFLYTGGAAVDVGPAGFTLLQAGSSNSNVWGALYFKIVGSGNAGASRSVTATAAKLNAALVVYSGTDPTTPIVTSAVASETTTHTTHAAPSLTSAIVGRLIECLSLRDTSAAVSSVWTPPSPAVSEVTVNKPATSSVVGVMASSPSPDIAAGTFTGNWTIDASSQNAVTFAAFLAPGVAPSTGPIVSGRSAGAWVDAPLLTRESGSWV